MDDLDPTCYTSNYNTPQHESPCNLQIHSPIPPQTNFVKGLEALFNLLMQNL